MTKSIIVAIDDQDKVSFNRILDCLDPNLCMVKIGSINFNSLGREFIEKVHVKEVNIFLDLKLHDIPNTCISTIKAIKDLKVNYLTIHISSGPEALKACKKVSGKTKLIGVTILTSLDNKALKEIGFNKDVRKLVYHQAKLAKKAKLDAIAVS